MRLRARSFLFALLFTGLASALSAQEFYGGGVTARTAAHAGIYVPASDNAMDALALNPAGLATLGGPTANINVSGMWAAGSFSNSANSGSPMSQTAGIVPFGAFGTPLGHSRWSLGLGFTPDLLSSANWNYKDAPGVAGADYGLQREKSAILAFRSSVGAAFAITPNLSLGVAVGAVYNSNTLTAPYIFQSNPSLKGLKTLVDLHTNGVGWNQSFGLLARPLRKLELGVAYRTSTSIVSTGDATGDMGAQFSSLGIPFRRDFAYKAQVKVNLPQSALINALWQATPNWRFSLQSDWTDWNNAFRQLPVSLSEGTNADINSFLHSSSIKDTVPLNWKNQIGLRAGVDRMLGENLSVSGGFVHGNNPVPASTLSPLTAAIMKNGLSSGFGYRLGRYRFDLAYVLNLSSESQVGTSALLSGEYSNSRVKIGTQALTFSTSFRL